MSDLTNISQMLADLRHARAGPDGEWIEYQQADQASRAEERRVVRYFAWSMLLGIPGIYLYGFVPFAFDYQAPQWVIALSMAASGALGLFGLWAAFKPESRRLRSIKIAQGIKLRQRIAEAEASSAGYVLYNALHIVPFDRSHTERLYSTFYQALKDTSPWRSDLHDNTEDWYIKFVDLLICRLDELSKRLQIYGHGASPPLGGHVGA